MMVNHGGDVYSRKIKYDFSANINPLGMPDSVKKALITGIEKFERYPDVNCTELRNAVSSYENISPEKIVFGNGAADLIYRIVQFLKPKKALITAPTFSEYERALKSVGCEVDYFLTDENTGFEITEAILDKLYGMDIVFVCNPNNPTGNVINKSVLRRLKDISRKEKIYLVIDECFMDFVDKSCLFRSDASEKHIIILKAFTKIYAMAGLRLGYMLCDDVRVVQGVENTGQCWSVSAVAQLAGKAALSEIGYIEKTLRVIKTEREYLTAELQKLGFKVYPSKANFILFRSDAPLYRLLLNEKIAVRCCGNYVNLDDSFFRIAVRNHCENIVLISKIQEVMKNG